MELAYITIGFCVSALIGLWFYIAYKDLSQAKNQLDHAKAQLMMHKELLMRTRGEEQEFDAEHMVKTSNLIYEKALREYRLKLHRLLYRVPAFVLGFCHKDDQST